MHIFQPPGAGNALGRIRFNFPNKFLVYQHDTPDKYLFAKDKRAYSHGCMRVQNPLDLRREAAVAGRAARALHRGATGEACSAATRSTSTSRRTIWVHLTYQTAFVDEDGKLQFREDVYGRDARMIAILKGSERKVADIAIERRPDPSSKPVRAPVGMYGGSDSSYSSGGSFFDFIFGGAPFEPAAPAARASWPAHGQ